MDATEACAGCYNGFTSYKFLNREWLMMLDLS